MQTVRISCSTGKLPIAPASASSAPRRSLCSPSAAAQHIKRAALAAAASLALATAPAHAACPDLIASPTGLKYCDVTVGTGDVPVKGAFIKVHYSGRLDSDIASGTFDSSSDRGRPFGFAVGTGQVIRGWDVGFLGGDGVEPMHTGGKRQLVIPPELGYGTRGAGGVIPPNATLYFDVELLGRLGQK